MSEFVSAGDPSYIEAPHPLAELIKEKEGFVVCEVEIDLICVRGVFDVVGIEGVVFGLSGLL